MHREQVKLIIEWAGSLPDIAFAKLQEVIPPLATPVTRLQIQKSIADLNLSNLRVGVMQVIGPTGITAAGKVNLSELFPIEYYSKEYNLTLVMKHENLTLNVDATGFVKNYLDLYGSDLLSKNNILRTLLDSLLECEHFVHLEQSQDLTLKLVDIQRQI